MSALVNSDKKSLSDLKAVAAQSGNDNKQYLTFMLGGEMFSLSILAIKEIIWYANLTDVPMLPAC